MRKQGISWLACVSLAAPHHLASMVVLVCLLLAPGCARKKQIGLGEPFQMGPFTLRVTAVNAYTRSHQGVPFEVEVRVTCEGGNRFERMDLGELVSRKAKIYFSTAGGWRDRGWLIAAGDDQREFVIHANPPLDSKGFVLDIGNPYAKSSEPSRFVIDLGR